jgi:cytochrome c551/c552
MIVFKLIKVLVVICFVSALAILAACSSHEPQAPKTLAEYDATGKSPEEIAQFVYDNYDCNSCHTLSEGKFGYSERGQQIRQQSDGCVSLLTSMNVIAQVKESDRTPEHKQKAAHFEQYGCTMCHQITPGKLGLTDTGAKLESLHLGCVEVETLLNQRAANMTR